MPGGILEQKRTAEVLWYVGCVSSFYPMAYKIPQAMVQILGRSNVDFTLLGGTEWCCGFPVYRSAEISSVIPRTQSPSWNQR